MGNYSDEEVCRGLLLKNNVLKTFKKCIKCDRQYKIFKRDNKDFYYCGYCKTEWQETYKSILRNSKITYIQFISLEITFLTSPVREFLSKYKEIS